jgi:hypothetical protein
MSVTLTMAVATCQPELLYKSLVDAAKHAQGPVDLVVFGNGCEIARERIPAPIRLLTWEGASQNYGVPYALHRLWDLARSAYPALPSDQHVIAYLHDDLFMREDGWNTRIARCFANPEVTLAGVLGSPGLGRDEIYRDPYEFWHLSRTIATWSNVGNAEIHGERVTTEREVVFVDGVAMCLRRDFLDKVGGWSWWPPNLVHHAYDYGLSCMVRRHGGRVWLVPVACKHGVRDFEGIREVEHRVDPIEESAGGGHSGTYGAKVYTDLADKYGGDTAVHRAGHRWVYDEFRDVLPLRMRP